MKINKNIFLTLFVRIGVAVVNMITVFLTLNVLGANGRGKISLFVTDLVLISMFTNILGGSTISYHTPKTNLKPLVKYAFGWVLVVSFCASLILNFFHDEYLQKHLFFISLINGLLFVNQMILIGNQNIKKYNVLFVLDPLLKLLVLLIGFYLFKNTTLQVFLYSLYISTIVSFCVSVFFVYKYIKFSKLDLVFRFKDILKYGLGTELSSSIQFLNYRLLFYVVFYQLGATALGWFSVAVSIAESAWIVSRSITVNQYSQILNTSNYNKQRVITNKSVWLSLGLTLPVCLFLIFIPNNFLQLIVKNSVQEIHEIVIYLCPGILCISISNVWGHYFSGIGRYFVNNLKSIIGFCFMFLSGVILIPKFEILGAVIATVVGYLASSLTLAFFYFKKQKTDLL